MNDHKILFTGDFWHADFKTIISSIDVPITLVPIEKIDSVSDQQFDLIVVAQSRRDQFSSIDVEKIQTIFANTPTVSLLGSWCEGESRSGTPYPGLIRVYWHQWEGRYQKFVDQLAQEELTEWHAPMTSSVADRIASSSVGPETSLVQCVGISAWSNTQHEMYADAVKCFGWKSRWVERGAWGGSRASLLSAVVIDADSWSGALSNRVNWLRTEFPRVPMVLTLNYPRENELDEISQSGISAVVSKPFELEDLRQAIQLAVSGDPARVQG